MEHLETLLKIFPDVPRKTRFFAAVLDYATKNAPIFITIPTV
jgi:hypothetical protein